MRRQGHRIDVTTGNATAARSQFFSARPFPTGNQEDLSANICSSRRVMNRFFGFRGEALPHSQR